MPDERDTAIERTQIIETINRLFIGTDNRDWALVKECLAPRVRLDMSSVGAGPPKELAAEAIAAGWEAGLAPLAAIHHQVGNYLVRVAGATAEAFCYGIATHYLPNKTGKNTRTFVGSYDVELLKNDGRWRINKFKFNLKYVDGNPNLENS